MLVGNMEVREMGHRIYLYMLEAIITIGLILLLIIAMKPVMKRIANSRSDEAQVVQEFYGGAK